MGVQTDKILIERFLKNHPREAARIVKNLGSDEIISLLENLPDFLAGQVIIHLDLMASVRYLQELKIEKVIGIIENIPYEIVSLLIRKLPLKKQEEFLPLFPAEMASNLNKTLNYPIGTAGAIMDPFVHTFLEDLTVGEVKKSLLQDTELNLNYIYIVNTSQRLTGVLSLHELLRTRSSQILSSVMNKTVTKIYASTPHSVVMEDAAWQEYHILPVVDRNDLFLGILRSGELYRLQQKKMEMKRPQKLTTASMALGELYRLGITSLIQGASDVYRSNSPK